MQESEGDDLPAFMVDGVLKTKARYPNRVELAGWFGIEAVETVAAAPTPCCEGSTDAATTASGCCGGASQADMEQAAASSCC